MPELNQSGTPQGLGQEWVSAENGEQNASRNSRSDHTGDVGAHGMHEEEVLGVGFKADLVGHACRHGHGRDTCGTNQGVDRV